MTRLGDIATACNGVLVGASVQAHVASISTDTRTLKPGDLFVAIRGENFNGHDFADAAMAAGAVAVVSDHDIIGVPCIVVPNTLIAYADIARAHLQALRQQGKPRVVGITGSSGKTSTKDLITDVLSGEGDLVSPPGSFNNEIGLPATVLRATGATTHLVLEMGMRGLGHIAHLCEIAAPDIAVLINIGTAHIGEVGSQEAIAQAKSEILSGMTVDGVAVLNADDRLVMSLTHLVRSGRIITFGEDPASDVRITDVALDEQARASFNLAYQGRVIAVSLQLYGEHQIHNAAAAAAVGIACDVPLEHIGQALNSATPRSKWRMEVTHTADGITVINDAYNANPESVRAALKSLVAMTHGGQGRTWAVLGEMRELGDITIAEHDAIGRLAVRLDISRLIAVGEGARPIHMGAAHEGSWGNESMWVPDVDAALQILRQELTAGDVVLVKASRSIGLERVATTLLAEHGTVVTP